MGFWLRFAITATLCSLVPLVLWIRDPAILILLIEQPESHIIFGPLSENDEVSQRFQATADGLCRIDIFFATYQQHISGQIQVLLYHVPSGPSGARAEQFERKIEINGPDIHDNAYHAARFPAIIPAKNLWFDLVVRAPEIVEHHSVGLYGSLLETDIPGGVKISGVEQQGTLRFRVWAGLPLSHAAIRIVSRSDRGKPPPLRGPMLHTLILSLWLLAIAAIFALLPLLCSHHEYPKRLES